MPAGGLVPGAVALLGGLSGVVVLYADDESFTYMTPEGHPFSGWITFSSHADEAGTTVAQAQLLIRANDPIYAILMPLVLHRLEDATWQRALGRAAEDRKSTRLNSSHANISYAVFCLYKK